MHRIVAACLFFLSSMSLFAQRFGGTPPSVKWRQINTDSARIIFPAGLDSQAQRIASIIHYEAAQTNGILGNRVRKINIVLQNQTTFANGYVGLGPFRSEFYLTPSPNNFELGSLAWSDQLAIHEYRHVEQFNNFRNGISNLMHILFGQEGYALAVNAAVPDWFYEGDAVYNETVLSKQGRGRLPLFLNAYPALWQAGKHYSWMKLRNGSFKDYVPDHYNLGYLMVNYGREKYGIDFWKKVTRDATAFNGLFYPFQHAVKKYSGISYKEFRTEALNSYKQKTEETNAALPAPATDSFALTRVNKRVLTNYEFPYSVSTDSLVYLRTSTNRRPAFFIRDQRGERVLRVKDISIDDQFSYKNGRIVYSAYENDARWRWRDYSVVKVLDVATGQQRTITHKTKYFTPDISASGEKIAVVEIATTGKSELHVLDAGTGEVQTRISSAEIGLFTDPKFIGEDSLVTAVRLQDGRMSLAIADLKNGSTVRLTPPSFNVVGYPCVSNRMVYFTASYNGSDNVYVVNLDDRKISRITNRPLGNYFVNVANGKMTWSVFTADGYQLQQVSEASLQLEPVSTEMAETQVTPFAVSHASEFNEIIPGNFSLRNFPVSKYRKGTRLINFHSWRPYYEDPEFTFSLYGENVLNTLQTQLYYLYNQDDKTSAVGLTATYARLFPYLSIGTQYTFDRKATLSNNTTTYFDELDSRIGFNIPLSWTSNRTNKSLNFGGNYYYRNDFFKIDTLGNRNFSYLQYFLQWNQQVEQATQHIFARFGYSLSGDLRHTITTYNSWQTLEGATLYLPGLLRTHSIVLTAAIQETDTSTVLFGNRFSYSRGYNEAYFSRMWRASANYHFPLLYPDFGIASILYFQRIRANGFYDFTRVYSNDKRSTADQRSVGGEIFIDTKWWNQYQLTFGFRVSHLLDRDFYSGKKGVNVFEFVLPVSIFPQ